MKYGIEVGQIYIAASRNKCGHLVTDVSTFAHCDDVITNPFTPNGFGGNGYRIDAFKLAMVRYTLAEVPPEWMPTFNRVCI